MFNHPFSITANNYTTEKTTNSQPANFLGHNVILAQEQQRNIHDCTTTTITGMPQFYTNCPNVNVAQCCTNCPSNGVTYTFNTNQPIVAKPIFANVPNIPNSWSNNFPTLPNKQSNDLTQLQDYFKNEPCMLRFHTDRQTSTTDLTPQDSHGTDLKNLSGLFERLPDWMKISPTSQSYKRLILKNPKIAKEETSIVDDLIAEEKAAEKKGTDVEVQTNLCCCNKTKTDDDEPKEETPKKSGGKSKSVHWWKKTPSESFD